MPALPTQNIGIIEDVLVGKEYGDEDVISVP
jgi:hypothetical protein